MGFEPNEQFGFFANRNPYGHFDGYGIIDRNWQLNFYLNKRKWLLFVVILFATGIMLGILGYSVSRAGLILFIAFQIIWVLAACKKHLNHKFLISFLVLFGLLITLFFISDTILEDRLESLISKDNNY